MCTDWLDMFTFTDKCGMQVTDLRYSFVWRKTGKWFSDTCMLSKLEKFQSVWVWKLYLEEVNMINNWH
jgi:hypothetical protein